MNILLRIPPRDRTNRKMNGWMDGERECSLDIHIFSLKNFFYFIGI